MRNFFEVIAIPELALYHGNQYSGKMLRENRQIRII